MKITRSIYDCATGKTELVEEEDVRPNEIAIPDIKANYSACKDDAERISFIAKKLGLL